MTILTFALMVKSLIECLPGDEALPALHFLAETTILSNDTTSTCKDGEAGSACARGHGQAHHERDKVGLCSALKLFTHLIRKCPKCGTYNGTRGLSCKNKQCDMVFKEAEQKNNKKFG